MSVITPTSDDRIQIGADLYRLEGTTLVKVNNLPTEPGLYAPGRSVPSRVNNLRYLLLNTQGKWFWLDYTAVHFKNTLEPVDPSIPEKYELTPVDTNATRAILIKAAEEKR